MEFPQLGEHCSVASCKVLDFLPIQCDACSKTFCGDHFSYLSHKCAHSHANDVQVPVCPLCSCPVSGFKRGDPPDIAVSQHLDNLCKNPGNKVYANRCSSRSCKNKEIVPIRCGQCRRNFCLKHRHPTDHECRPEKTQARPATSSNTEAMQRDRASMERQTREDEELARAIQASLNENVPKTRGCQGSGSTSRNPPNPPLYMPPPSTVDQPSCVIS